MQDLQTIADRVKFVAKQKGISLKDMFSDLEMNVNTVSLIAKGREISFVNFTRIAEYFDCSVDYLLGRTTVYDVNKGDVYNVQNSPLSAQGDNNSINVSNASVKRAGMLDEMLKQFETLSFADKAEIMHIIAGKAKHEQA